MVAGPQLILSGGAGPVDPLYQQQRKAVSGGLAPQSEGLTHGPSMIQGFISNHATSGRGVLAGPMNFRAPKRAREEESDSAGSKQLHVDKTSRDVSQLLRHHGIDIRPVEPEPEPQRGAPAAKLSVVPAAVCATHSCRLRASVKRFDPATPLCRAGGPH